MRVVLGMNHPHQERSQKCPIIKDVGYLDMTLNSYAGCHSMLRTDIAHSRMGRNRDRVQ